ncbi:major facilitator superfamily domain-containing protein [Suillus fuscotomentosus]|uniref:Major facilitator superfamily domain-containing protein n=1 Tax=Suillus fuscotomentosus TaxID=1912939 RepID=A0AAD4EG68_9AGAM|nr:major facilitator superfamily domain-containing protein [Suillus fuscotomentosus]XP_041231130.1 major facilitator superfamily domain-containing protein [Suillus fuscotomentosus]KAG1896505.1 major facilitator superfamily domain-containing protein [Suillus fuscotomentosus]KAG1905555.1 major facilitator superfamily domain-containing protein [Suillus fuscotomentosus]
MAEKKVALSSISLIFACGTALFSDGYANNVIGAVNTLLERIYGTGSGGITTNYSTTLSSVAFAGTVVGMLTFGYLSDKAGRKFGMMSATGIVAIFSGLSAASSGANHSLDGMLAMLIACRFLLGIGVGAEYPCGSVAASEQSEEEGIAKNSQHRWLVLATNTMIDVGFVIGAFVPLVLYWIFGDNHLRAVWRLSLGLGVVPAVAVFFWRLRMEEPNRYKRDSMKHVRIPYRLIIKRYWRGLFGISLVWFIYDFITYPFGLYSSTVTNAVTGGNSSLTVVFGWSVVINLFYIPGTVVGAFFVDLLGPKVTIITGLLAQAVIGFIMSGLYTQLSQHIGAFAVVYGIFLSFGEFGPGNCLGVLGAKSGPTAVRGQYYGFAAAVGKIGAFIGTWVFPIIVTDFGGSSSPKGNTGPFWVGSGLAILSAIVVYFFVTPLDHDGMKKEDAKFREYLEANGFDVSLMGLPEIETVSYAEGQEISSAIKDTDSETKV